MEKILDMMNRLGHCASYNTIEEIETELTVEAKNNGRVTPHGMIPSLNCGIGLARDNFDRFVDIFNGKTLIVIL